MSSTKTNSLPAGSQQRRVQQHRTKLKWRVVTHLKASFLFCGHLQVFVLVSSCVKRRVDVLRRDAGRRAKDIDDLFMKRESESPPPSCGRCALKGLKMSKASRRDVDIAPAASSPLTHPPNPHGPAAVGAACFIPLFLHQPSVAAECLMVSPLGSVTVPP